MQQRASPLTPRFVALALALCAVATLATPYAVLKLGMSVDMAFAGMFVVAALLGRAAKQRKDLAIQLNLIQTMINVVQGIGFMVVILAAFHYIILMTGRTELALGLSWWQIAIWLMFSAALGIFMGVLPRKLILNDETLPWPSGQAMVSVVGTLADPDANSTTARRRRMLGAGTVIAGIVSFLRDGKGLIPSLNIQNLIYLTVSLDLIGFGFGLLLPLSVGLSGLIGVGLIYTYGEQVAIYAALNGTAPEHWDACLSAVTNGTPSDFVTTSCSQGAAYLTIAAKDGNAFKFVVQWMMWPATAMMVAAGVTGAIAPLIRNLFAPRKAATKTTSLANEEIPLIPVLLSITVCILALIVIQHAWLQIPWYDVLLSVAVQPILILTGVRILAITGSGPVSLMGNAMQAIFAIFRPDQLRTNLAMSHLAADANASAEATTVSFWTARRIGGSFKGLIIAQLIALPVGAFLTPLAFQMMVETYGIGYGDGQLSAPTGLKIASLAVMMEKGAAGLPFGAFEASIAAVIVGVILELLLALRRTDSEGKQTVRFPWLPVPSAVGFAMILPPSLMIAIATGSIVAALWRTVSRSPRGTYAIYAHSLASGLLAGESIMGGVILPLLMALRML